MFWLLLASLALNAFLAYGWMHDMRLKEQSVRQYEAAYHRTLDAYCGNPPGTTKRRTVEMWPEGGELRAKGDREYREEYGGPEEIGVHAAERVLPLDGPRNMFEPWRNIATASREGPQEYRARLNRGGGD